MMHDALKAGTEKVSPNIWPILGMVRFLLALIVAASHSTWFDTGNRIAYNVANFSSLAAVIGFLVISGFSIAHSIETTPRGYFMRRARRILPCYVLSIVLAMVCVMPFGGFYQTLGAAKFQTPAISSAVANLFFLQGFTAFSIQTNPAVWTLSIEVLFYALAPLITRMSTAAIAVTTAASATLYVLSGTQNLPHYVWLLGGMPFLLLGWSWLLGFLAYRIMNQGRAAIIVAAVLVTALAINTRYLGGFWVITVVAVALAIGVGGEIRVSRTASKVMNILGDSSYPLYLLHMPSFIPLTWLGVTSGTMLLATVVGISIAVDQLYDKPVKRLVGRFIPKAHPATQSAGQCSLPARSSAD